MSPKQLISQLPCRTMSITILRSDCRCFLLRFWKMSQFSSCRSLKPTARWWFSRTDESLYISASSESEGRRTEKVIKSHTALQGTVRRLCRSSSSQLTGVDEELIGDSRVIHVMDGAGKQSGEDLQVGKNSLDRRSRRSGMNHI